MNRRIIALLITSLIFSFGLLQGCSLLDIGDIKEALDLNNDFSAEEIYEFVSPSVVEITGEMHLGESTGTGFFYDNEGTVITNYHVIEDCVSAKITLSNGASYDVVAVLGYSKEKDIAILSTSCSSSIPLKIRNTGVKTGEQVYAIGSSLGLSGSLSDGIISSAEREIGGHTYIQTTAPISQGNSGGPLIDTDGNVIGITSASFVDGQNLNLAIPIKEILSISTNNPVRLYELFSSDVEWLFNWEFIYYDDEEQYVLLFELADQKEIPMSSSGTVEIRIVNDVGETVYEAIRLFTESDFSTWTQGDIKEYFYASIYIAPDEISAGLSEKGTVYFTVYGDTFSFEEEKINVVELPVKPISISFPGLPLTVHSYGYDSSIETTVRIDKITYERAYEDSLYIYFAGEKIFDINGKNGDSWCSFEWKFYDSEGYLIDKGTFYTDSLSVGDKFKEKYIFIADGIKTGESYRLVIVGAEESDKIEFESYYVGLRTISVSDEKTAQKIMDAWRDAGATEEAMIALMNEYGVEQGGGQLYLVQPGEFIEEVDDWCFDRVRKVGDVVILKTAYGYTICYLSSIVER